MPVSCKDLGCLESLSTLFLGTGSSVNLELAYLVRPTGQSDLQIPHFPSNEITGAQSHVQLLHGSGGSQTWVLVLVWQILYQLS
jgi:hypothetical protein